MKTNDEKTPGNILKVDVLGRVRTPAEQREAILDSFEQSGMPGTRFAEQHGINYQTFASWVQKRRRGRGDYGKRQPCEKPGPPRKGGDQVPGRSPLTLVEVSVGEKIPGPSQKSSPTPGLRVELAGGTALVLENKNQAALAAELIRQLTTSNKPC